MPLVSVGRERAEGVVTERYTYDPLRRLTGVTDSEGFRAVYEYDASGNRTRWWANDDPPPWGKSGMSTWACMNLAFGSTTPGRGCG
jgi:YD repeat-containing protein